MKRTVHHIALILLLASACEDPLEDKVFTPEDAHVRFEFNFGITTNPVFIPSDTIGVFRPIDTLRVPVVLSSPPLEEEVQIRFSVNMSDNIQPGEVLVREEGFSETDFLLTIPPGTFETSLLVLIYRVPGELAYLTLSLEEVTPSFLGLGLPGPQQQRRSFTIALIDL